MRWIVNDGPPATSQRAAPSVQGKAQDVPLCAPQKWVPRSRLIEWSEVSRTRGSERVAPLPHASSGDWFLTAAAGACRPQDRSDANHRG